MVKEIAFCAFDIENFSTKSPSEAIQEWQTLGFLKFKISVESPKMKHSNSGNKIQSTPTRNAFVPKTTAILKMTKQKSDRIKESQYWNQLVK